MSKFIAVLLFLAPLALSMPHGEHFDPWAEVDEDKTPSPIIWPSISKVPVMLPRHHRPDHLGGANDYAVQEVVHVHHVPVKIPLYAGIIVQDYKQSANSDTCDAPRESGLKNLLRQAKSLLPLPKIRDIVRASVVNDQQVQALIALVRSEAFRTKAREITQSRDFLIIVDYACKVLHLNVRDVGRFLNALFGMYNGGQYDPTAEFKGRPGVRGLLMDIRDVLPRQELKDLYQKLMTTDVYLSQAVQQLKAKEFRQLVRNLLNVPQFLEVREQLRNAGLPLQELKDLIVAAIGQYVDELDDNSEELKI